MGSLELKVVERSVAGEVDNALIGDRLWRQVAYAEGNVVRGSVDHTGLDADPEPALRRAAQIEPAVVHIKGNPKGQLRGGPVRKGGRHFDGLKLRVAASNQWKWRSPERAREGGVIVVNACPSQAIDAKSVLPWAILATERPGDTERGDQVRLRPAIR